MVRVREGTQTGDRLRLRGLGFPRLGGYQRGDQFVVIRCVSLGWHGRLCPLYESSTCLKAAINAAASWLQCGTRLRRTDVPVPCTSPAFLAFSAKPTASAVECIMRPAHSRVSPVAEARRILLLQGGDAAQPDAAPAGAAGGIRGRRAGGRARQGRLKPKSSGRKFRRCRPGVRLRQRPPSILGGLAGTLAWGCMVHTKAVAGGGSAVTGASVRWGGYTRLTASPQQQQQQQRAGLTAGKAGEWCCRTPRSSDALSG